MSTNSDELTRIQSSSFVTSTLSLCHLISLYSSLVLQHESIWSSWNISNYTHTHIHTTIHTHKEQWLVYLIWHWIETNTHSSLACVERWYYLLSTISRHLYLGTQRELLYICFNASNLSRHLCQTPSPLSTCIIPAGSSSEKNLVCAIWSNLAGWHQASRLGPITV